MSIFYLIVFSFFLHSHPAQASVDKPLLVEPIKKIVESNNDDSFSCALDAEGLKCWGWINNTKWIKPFQEDVVDFEMFFNGSGVCYFFKDEVVKCDANGFRASGMPTVNFNFQNISSLEAIGDNQSTMCVNDVYLGEKRRTCFHPGSTLTYAYNDIPGPQIGFPPFFDVTGFPSRYTRNELLNSKVEFNACHVRLGKGYEHDHNQKSEEILKKKFLILDEQASLSIAKNVLYSHTSERNLPVYKYELDYSFPHETSVSGSSNSYGPIKVSPFSNLNSGVYYIYNYDNYKSYPFETDAKHLHATLNLLPELGCSRKLNYIFHEIKPRLSTFTRPDHTDRGLALIEHDLRFVKDGATRFFAYTGIDGTSKMIFEDSHTFNTWSYENFHLHQDKKTRLVKAYDRNWKVIAEGSSYFDPWLRRFSAGGKTYSCFIGNQLAYRENVYTSYNDPVCYQVSEKKIRN